MFWVRAPLAFGPGEKACAKAVIAQQVAHCPLGERQHPPPLAEDDDLAPLVKHELPDELAQLGQLGAESPWSVLSSGRRLRIVGQRPSN